MRRFVVSSVVVASLVLIVGTVVASIPQQTRTTYFASSFPGYELGDLQRKAESIAVVRPSGASQMRWNSDANKAWTPEVGSGKLALIYRDDDFEVVRLVAGATLPSKLVIRGLGGTVGSDKHVYDGQPEWQKGREYLVFLRQEDTPTESGMEKALTIVWIGHGAFRSAGSGEWVNEVGFALNEADLAK